MVILPPNPGQRGYHYRRVYRLALARLLVQLVPSLLQLAGQTLATVLLAASFISSRITPDRSITIKDRIIL